MLKNDPVPPRAESNIDSGRIAFKTGDTLQVTDVSEMKEETVDPREGCSPIVMTITDEHKYTLSPSEARRKLENELNEKDMIIKSLRKEIVKYKKKYMRQGSSIREVQLSLSSAKEKAFISEHLLRALNNNLSSLMMEILARAAGGQNGEYSNELKKFALNVYSCSPAAYVYLRHNLNYSLPHVNMIRRWRSMENIRRFNRKQKLLSTAVGSKATATARIGNQANQLNHRVNQALLSLGVADQEVLSADMDIQAILSSDTENRVLSPNV